jgi:hypothetical protein
MNLFKKLIKNNWLQGFSENTLTYDELTIKLNEVNAKYEELNTKHEERSKILKDSMTIKQLLEWKNTNLEKELVDMLHDFTVLFKFVEKRKLSGPISDKFKNTCSSCLMSGEYANMSCSRFGRSCALKTILSELEKDGKYFFDSTQKKNFITKIQVSISLMDKINKLRLHGDRDHLHLSWSPDNFIEWLENEQLTEYDFNYLFADPLIIQYPEIIKAAESRKKELTRKTKPKKRKESMFLDKEGKITWYIKNTSPNHVVISDLDVTINRGKALDALIGITAKQIEKSRDLKMQIEVGNIKRLTEKEYIVELKKSLERHPADPRNLK